jgi:hypothetical protein
MNINNDIEKLSREMENLNKTFTDIQSRLELISHNRECENDIARPDIKSAIDELHKNHVERLNMDFKAFDIVVNAICQLLPDHRIEIQYRDTERTRFVWMKKGTFEVEALIRYGSSMSIITNTGTRVHIHSGSFVNERTEYEIITDTYRSFSKSDKFITHLVDRLVERSISGDVRFRKQIPSINNYASINYDDEED